MTWWWFRLSRDDESHSDAVGILIAESLVEDQISFSCSRSASALVDRPEAAIPPNAKAFGYKFL